APRQLRPCASWTSAWMSARPAPPSSRSASAGVGLGGWKRSPAPTGTTPRARRTRFLPTPRQSTRPPRPASFGAPAARPQRDPPPGAPGPLVGGFLSRAGRERKIDLIDQGGAGSAFNREGWWYEYDRANRTLTPTLTLPACRAVHDSGDEFVVRYNRGRLIAQ